MLEAGLTEKDIADFQEATIKLGLKGKYPWKIVGRVAHYTYAAHSAKENLCNLVKEVISMAETV